MAIQTINGHCVHIEVDGEEGVTHATFTFKTPSLPETLGGFITMLAHGIEILVPLPDLNDEEPEDDD
ncbi:MAG: hypothetical protein ACO27L_06940 [Schleiferiaceae bacterium]|jgi:hypothetical protein